MGFLRGRPFTELREEGRWTSDSSLRIYLDLIATSTEHAELDAKHHLDMISKLDANFERYFRRWPGCPAYEALPLPAELLELLRCAIRRWPIPMKEGAAAKSLRSTLPTHPCKV